MSRSRLFPIIALLAIMALAPQGIFGCTICKKNLNGWGFCREISYYGYNLWNCVETPVDPVSGRTTCTYGDAKFGECDWRGQTWPYGDPSGGGGGGGGGTGDCAWTDVYGQSCILDY